MLWNYRKAFNERFSGELYQKFLQKLSAGYTDIPFRVAETPVFIPDDLATQLIAAGEEIIDLIKRKDFKSLTDTAVPPEWLVPNENRHPHFLTFDFGICKNDAGKLMPMLIEMQGFPSLYGFQPHLANGYIDIYHIGDYAQVSPYFNGMIEAEYIALLKSVIVGTYEPHEVALVDIDALNQKTAIDFHITARLLDIKILSPTDIIQENRKLFYLDNGRKIRLKRIYNRMIFDELDVGAKTPIDFEGGFDPREEVDVEWITHPNWFYRISKFTMPFIKSDFVPETHFLSDFNDQRGFRKLPEDLENYVLKPLFSFAGMGVIIDVHLSDIEKIADPENWILQRKVVYEPVVESLQGGVKVEIRLMYIWPEDGEPQLCINLARLSRGKMIGVRYNGDFDWVGGSVGLMEFS